MAPVNRRVTICCEGLPDLYHVGEVVEGSLFLLRELLVWMAAMTEPVAGVVYMRAHRAIGRFAEGDLISVTIRVQGQVDDRPCIVRWTTPFRGAVRDQVLKLVDLTRPDFEEQPVSVDDVRALASTAEVPAT